MLVTVLGCGGIGVPAAWTLALAGVKQLRLIDGDRVELSNLHRQVLYSTADIGQPKAEVLARALQQRFPDLRYEVTVMQATVDNFDALLQNCTYLLEASDQAELKFIASDWAIQQPRQRTVTIAAAIGRRGQWLTVTPQSACYRCIFEAPPPPELLSTCQIAGVLGPAVGQVGAFAARSLVRAMRGQAEGAIDGLIRLQPQGITRIGVQKAEACICATPPQKSVNSAEFAA